MSETMEGDRSWTYARHIFESINSGGEEEEQSLEEQSLSEVQEQEQSQSPSQSPSSYPLYVNAMMGACRADERSPSLHSISISEMANQARYSISISEMAVVLRCLCAPLVSLRVGIVNRLASLLCPIPSRGRLNLIMTPASCLELSFVGDDGHTQQLCSITCNAKADANASSSHDSQLVIVEEIAADASGRSFLVKLTHSQPQQVFYYWLSHKSLSHGLHLLHKMKDILTRRPTLSDLTGISRSRLDSLATHMQACLLTPNLAGAVVAAVAQSIHSETALPVSTNVPSMSSPSSPSSSSPSSKEGKNCIKGTSSLSSLAIVGGIPNVSPLVIPSLPFNSPSATQSLPSSPAIVGLSAGLPPDFSPFNPLTFQFPLPSADRCSMDKQPLVKPHYCWCPMGPSHVSSTLPPLPLPPFAIPPPVVGSSSPSLGMGIATTASDCTKLLHDPLVHLPLPVSSLVIPPLPGSSQFSAFTGLMSDPIVHVPVMDICSAGQAYLVSAGPAISAAVPPLVVKPLVATTESVVEKNARQTLMRLLESAPMPSPMHAAAFGVDVSSAIVSVETDPCLEEDMSNEASEREENEVEGRVDKT